MILHFWRKFKMAGHFGKLTNFLNLGRVYCQDTLWVENYDKITLSLMVKEIEAFMCMHFWRKFKNSKWLLFLERRKFFKIWAEYIA